MRKNNQGQEHKPEILVKNYSLLPQGIKNGIINEKG